MKVGDIELTEEEYASLQPLLKHLKEQPLGKIPTSAGKNSSSTKVYLPKTWNGDRVLMLRLRDTE